MNKKLQYIASFIAVAGFLLIAYGSGDNTAGEDSCGCQVPSYSTPSYADSWDDVEENWSYKECGIAESDFDAEKIHVYVYYNSTMDKYRCELLYSYPDNDCRSTSKNFGMQSTTVADITNSTYESGDWKTYNYWLMRQ